MAQGGSETIYGLSIFSRAPHYVPILNENLELVTGRQLNKRELMEYQAMLSAKYKASKTGARHSQKPPSILVPEMITHQGPNLKSISGDTTVNTSVLTNKKKKQRSSNASRLMTRTLTDEEEVTELFPESLPSVSPQRHSPEMTQRTTRTAIKATTDRIVYTRVFGGKDDPSSGRTQALVQAKERLSVNTLPGICRGSRQPAPFTESVRSPFDQISKTQPDQEPNYTLQEYLGSIVPGLYSTVRPDSLFSSFQMAYARKMAAQVGTATSHHELDAATKVNVPQKAWQDPVSETTSVAYEGYQTSRRASRHPSLGDGEWTAEKTKRIKKRTGRRHAQSVPLERPLYWPSERTDLDSYNLPEQLQAIDYTDWPESITTLDLEQIVQQIPLDRRATIVGSTAKPDSGFKKNLMKNAVKEMIAQPRRNSEPPIISTPKRVVKPKPVEPVESVEPVEEIPAHLVSSKWNEIMGAIRFTIKIQKGSYKNDRKKVKYKYDILVRQPLKNKRFSQYIFT